MTCPSCHRDAVADAPFCNHCGERLPARCRACDRLNPPGSAFCYACGSPISAAPPTGAYAAPPPPTAPAKCPRCSKTNEPGSAYCYSCGLPLDEPTTQRASAAPPPPTYEYAPYDPSRARRASASEYVYEYANVGEPAGFWIRLVPYYIDVIVSAAIAFAIAFAVTMVMYVAGNYDFVDGLIWFIFIGSQSIYYGIGWSRWSTTFGKRIFNLYVVRADGSKIGFWRAFARCLAYYISGMLFLVGFLIAAFRRDKRALHDLICDTVVVRRQ